MEGYDLKEKEVIRKIKLEMNHENPILVIDMMRKGTNHLNSSIMMFKIEEKEGELDLI